MPHKIELTVQIKPYASQALHRREKRQMIILGGQ